MTDACREYFRKIDARLDGALAPEEALALDAHLAECAGCRAERDSRAALKRALASLRLPAAPRRISMADLLPARRWGWSAAAAAVLVMALVLLSLPAPLPEVVALTSRLHDEFLDRRLTPDAIGLKVSIPGAEYVGQCACPPKVGAASPFIVYRKGTTEISLLVLEGGPVGLPASSRRTSEGRDYHSFRAGRNTVLLVRSHDLFQVWTSRLEEAELLHAIRLTREGRLLLGGERISLSEFT